MMVGSMKADEVKAWLMSQGLVIEENTNNNLQELLRDGLLLCQLANRLRPRSAAALNYNIENRSAWNDNVALFLEACDKIGVPKFSPADLIENKNMDAVLATMTELARKATAMGMGPKTSESSSSSSSSSFTGATSASVTVRSQTPPVTDKPYAEKPLSMLPRRSVQSLLPKDVVVSSVNSEDMSQLGLDAGIYGGSQKDSMADQHVMSRCKATFSYRGSNVDELQFHVGDVIEVTQKMEGGWWEGRVDEKLGWFPCVFTKELDEDGKTVEWDSSYAESLPPRRESLASPSPIQPAEPASYHSMVLQNAVTVEEAHVNELQAFLDKYLQALRSTSILNSSELLVLSGNIEELITFHTQFLTDLQETNRQPIAVREMGRCFLNVAPQVRQLCGAYCANHPQAVELLCTYGDKLSLFMESHGANGIMELTTNLSKPFRHLDMYPKVILEMQRHTPEDHVDRKNIDQALPIYEEIVVYTANTRRHKEQELEMLSGSIEGWTGEPISTLGTCSLMSTTKIRTADGDEDDRYLLLFAGYLVVLRVGDQLTGYSLVVKCPLSEAAIVTTDEIPHGISIIAGSQKMVVSTGSDEERDHVNSLWEKCSRLSTASFITRGKPTPPPSRHDSAYVNSASDVSLVSAMKQTRSFTVSGSMDPKSGFGQRRSESVTGPGRAATLAYGSRGTVTMDTEPVVTRARRWSFRSMRPQPPIKPALAVYGTKDAESSKSKKTMFGKGRRKSEVDDNLMVFPKGTEQKAREDDNILKVIEAYCTSNRAKHAEIAAKTDGDSGTTV